MTDSQATNKAIIERWYAAINRGDLDYADTIFGPGFAGGAGSAPVKRFLARLRTGIPDFALTIEDCFAAGEKVAVRGTLRGTHTGPYRHVAATGKPVAVSRLEIFEFAEGQIVQVWANHDELSLLEQLGAGLPDPDITTPIRRYFEEVHNERQFAVMDEIFGADWQLDGYKKFITMAHLAFPDMHFTILDQIVAGDKVVTRWILQGHHPNMTKNKSAIRRFGDHDPNRIADAYVSTLTEGGQYAQATRIPYPAWFGPTDLLVRRRRRAHRAGVWSQPDWGTHGSLVERLRFRCRAE